MQRVKTGDTVRVIAGKDKGAEGKVLRVLNDKNRVIVEHVNIMKKHQRPMQAGRGQVQPGIVEFEGSINLSNVMPICPVCNRPTRIGFKVNEDGRKVRVCKHKDCPGELD
jgi:large subunit ribosomal protein L24